MTAITLKEVSWSFISNIAQEGLARKIFEPHIVHVFEIDFIPNSVVMEFFEGKILADLIFYSEIRIIQCHYRAYRKSAMNY